jgi:hypothetical protein
MDKTEDLNPKFIWRTIVSLIDEELALYSIIQLENQRVVTKHMSEINFTSPPSNIIEIGIEVVI